MNAIIRCALGLGAAALGCAYPAIGNELVVSCEENAVILNGMGLSRHLFRFGDLEPIGNELVTAAWVEIPLAGPAPSPVRVRFAPLDRAWSAGTVSWTSPWHDAGGDLARAFVVTEEIGAGDAGGRLRLNVTEWVRSVLEGETADHGFLLTVEDGSRGGFRAAERALLEGAGTANLRIDYRSLTAQGIEGGSRAYLARREARLAEDRDR
jgi:hypothetical protein